MIILDTHIWVWWVHGDQRLTGTQAQMIESNETEAIGVSAISVWEIAKLVKGSGLLLTQAFL
jgi:PIN domain nuclease of toxin-antitoxin system